MGEISRVIPINDSEKIDRRKDVLILKERGIKDKFCVAMFIPRRHHIKINVGLDQVMIKYRSGGEGN